MKDFLNIGFAVCLSLLEAVAEVSIHFNAQFGMIHLLKYLVVNGSGN
jgi:hypothetical protein